MIMSLVVLLLHVDSYFRIGFKTIMSSLIGGKLMRSFMN